MTLYVGKGILGSRITRHMGDRKRWPPVVTDVDFLLRPDNGLSLEESFLMFKDKADGLWEGEGE